MWINVASVKHYLESVTAIEAKQSALNARKPLVGRREPHLWGLAPTGIHHLLLGNLTTVNNEVQSCTSANVRRVVLSWLSVRKLFTPPVTQGSCFDGGAENTGPANEAANITT